MEGEGDFRRWDELLPDALGLIFRELPLQELLTVIPKVCKSWRKTVMGPYCWQEIDIQEWCTTHSRPHLIDQMLRMLIPRSCGSLRELRVSCLRSDASFSFIAENAGSLQALCLKRSEISASIVEQTAAMLSTITFLDLSYCPKMGASALEAIGKHCKLLIGLCRNMHPLHKEGIVSQDDEAIAIASTMPMLKRLEMAYSLIGSESVLQILSSCPELECLDLRGCFDVKLDEQFFKEKFPQVKVLGPYVIGYYENSIEWEDYSDDSDGSYHLTWQFLPDEIGDYFDDDDEFYEGVWDNDGQLGELDLTFYEAIEDARMHDWPPSP